MLNEVLTLLEFAKLKLVALLYPGSVSKKYSILLMIGPCAEIYN